MVKLTKRKGFNFFRSYFDVYNELESYEDKVSFIDALLNRQFLGIKPEDLKGMAKFAYISQTNSIDSQVKGYNDKAQALNSPPLGGAIGVNKTILTPSLQVQEKEEEKVQEQCNYTQEEFFEDWNTLRTKHLKKPSFLNRIGSYEDKANFKELCVAYKRIDFQNAIEALFRQKVMPKGIKTLQTSPNHLLIRFERYLQAFHDKDTDLYGKKIEER